MVWLCLKNCAIPGQVVSKPNLSLKLSEVRLGGFRHNIAEPMANPSRSRITCHDAALAGVRIENNVAPTRTNPK